MLELSKKNVVYPPLDYLFRAFRTVRLQDYDIANTIILSSSGRGGSTWLAEILGSLNGYPVLWEPLHPGNNPECLQYGFNYRSYISEKTYTAQQRDYLEQLLMGQRLSTMTTSALSFNPSQFFQFRGFIVKFVNANLLLYWLARQFPVRSILMIRHPCAVISSQLKHGGWKHVNKKNVAFPKAVSDQYPILRQVFEQVSTPEEALAFSWVLKTFVPLRSPIPHPWHLVTYESLVENGKSELENIFSYLGKPVPSNAYNCLYKPSNTTQDESNVAKGRNPLTGWKHSLTAEQVTNILKIVHLSGIRFYSDALVPDKSELDTFCNQSELSSTG